MNENKE